MADRTQPVFVPPAWPGVRFCNVASLPALQVSTDGEPKSSIAKPVPDDFFLTGKLEACGDATAGCAGRGGAAGAMPAVLDLRVGARDAHMHVVQPLDVQPEAGFKLLEHRVHLTNFVGAADADARQLL